jgi:hypothetical protein
MSHNPNTLGTPNFKYFRHFISCPFGLNQKDQKFKAAYSFLESLSLDKPRNPNSLLTGQRMAWVALPGPAHLSSSSASTKSLRCPCVNAPLYLVGRCVSITNFELRITGVLKLKLPNLSTPDPLIFLTTGLSSKIHPKPVRFQKKNRPPKAVYLKILLPFCAWASSLAPLYKIKTKFYPQAMKYAPPYK